MDKKFYGKYCKFYDKVQHIPVISRSNIHGSYNCFQ